MLGSKLRGSSMAAFAGLASVTSAQYLTNGTFATEGTYGVRYDTGSFGPEVEEFHYFFDQWPTGISQSMHGKTMVSYTRGSDYAFTVGLVANSTHEDAYPSAEINTPAGGLYEYIDGVAYGSNDSASLISVTTLYTSTDNVIWALDSGRPKLNDSTLALARQGGPKLMGFIGHDGSLSSNVTLPVSDTCVREDSYILEVRFNLLANVTASGAGLAYIVDSPPDSNRTAIIVYDLGSGECWRRLESHPTTLPVEGDVPSYNGVPFLPTTDYRSNGLYGLELSYYGDLLYYHSKSSQYLYSIPTTLLISNDTGSDAAAEAAVVTVGQKGGRGNGMASDSNGMLYTLMPESNAIYIWNTTTGTPEPYVRDDRSVYPERAFVSFCDGYIYWIATQLQYQPSWNGGIDGRQYPALILRSLLPNNATKDIFLGPGDPTGNGCIVSNTNP